MDIRFGTKEDTQKVRDYLIESWMDHYNHESKYLNRNEFEKPNLNNYLKDCFNKSEKSFLFIAEENGEIACLTKKS